MDVGERLSLSKHLALSLYCASFWINCCLVVDMAKEDFIIINKLICLNKKRSLIFIFILELFTRLHK